MPTNIVNRRPSMAVKLDDSSVMGESNPADSSILQLTGLQSSESCKDESQPGSIMKAKLLRPKDELDATSAAGSSSANQNIEVSVTLLDDNSKVSKQKQKFLTDEDVYHHVRKHSTKQT